MYISIDTNELKADDARILRAIADSLDATPEPSGKDVVEADRKAEQAKAAPAAKKAAAPAKRAAAKPAPEPEPDEAEETEETATDGDEDALDVAVTRATSLVQAGKTPVVKKALAAVGVKRVSELSAEHVEDFLAALDEAE